MRRPRGRARRGAAAQRAKALCAFLTASVNAHEAARARATKLARTTGLRRAAAARRTMARAAVRAWLLLAFWGLAALGRDIPHAAVDKSGGKRKKKPKKSQTASKRVSLKNASETIRGWVDALGVC